MTIMKRLAVVLVAVLALSACAVTGQPARPGTAATYDGATITTDQVAAWGTAQTDMGYPYDPGAVLTLLMLRPALEEAAAAEGIALGDDQVRTEVKNWMKASGHEVTDPTKDMIDVVRTVRLLDQLLLTQDGVAALRTAAESIEAKATVSPLYGRFTFAQFASSFDTAGQAQQAQSSQLGDVSYLVFRDVSGFDVNAKRDWMGSAPEPSPSAVPAG